MTAKPVKIRLDELAAKLGAQLLGSPAIEICGINTIQDAGPGEICFLSSQKHVEKLKSSKAVGVLIQKPLTDCSMTQLVVGNVDKALIAVMTVFAPKLTSQKGIHPSATVEPDAKVDSTAAIGPGVYIGHCAKSAPVL
jgi:UDP-3-O-[3-hydroxymyristoyl] glucosamine N-acyltransferase